MVLALCVTGLVLAAYYSHRVLDRFPNSADEYAYLFQAETFAKGRLWNPTHRLQPFFSFRHIAERDGKWVGRFPPGWPGLIAAGQAAGIPAWLLNPILAGLSLGVLFLLGRRTHGRDVALATTAGVLFSAFFLFNAASHFSHVATLLFCLLFYHHGLRHLDRGGAVPAVLAGLWIGCAFLIRPYTALLVSAPLVVCFLATVPWRRWARGLWFVAGASPGFLLYLLYNFAITGDALLPVTVWADPREGIGFVGDHTLARGLRFSAAHLRDFALWASPAVLLLILPALWISARRRERWSLLPGSVFVVVVLGHVLYRVFGGNQYGPRFYFEAYPFAVLAAARLLFDDSVGPVVRRGARWLFAAGAAFALAALPLHTARERRVVEERTDVFRLVEREQLSHAIVLLSNGTGVLRPMPVPDLTRNDVDLRNDVLYARDLGDLHAWRLARAFPGRRLYRYSRARGEVEGRLDAVRPAAAATAPDPAAAP
jgi:4-amino-4-deoxy-L-arabinose transferase-like glycosyltransferase